MTLRLPIEAIFIIKFILLVGLYAASLPRQDIAKFSITSLIDSTIPAIAPIITGSSSRCEAFKSFFGLTYEQMQEKNATKFQEALAIDLITKNGNIKYDFTSTKSLTKILKNADKIIVLVHGFLESSDGVMVQGLAPEFLQQPGIKILALDGRKIINLEYFRSSTYARFMGEKLGSFLADIIKDGLDPSKIILIGHSLGAHIAGMAGKRVYKLTNQRVSRIAALDPAGLCFTNVNASNRLDKMDADYVDVIHTNSGVLGLTEPGTRTFIQVAAYFNLDASCQLAIIVEHGSFLLNLSVHLTISLCWDRGSYCEQGEWCELCENARKCEDWNSFKKGLCSKNEVAFMGMKSMAGVPGVYFLNTASSSPYGLGSAGSRR